MLKVEKLNAVPFRSAPIGFTYPDKKKKPYQNSTARWVFQCFQGVTIIYLKDQTPMVVNWKERQQVIIDCLGEDYRKMYS